MLGVQPTYFSGGQIGFQAPYTLVMFQQTLDKIWQRYQMISQSAFQQKVVLTAFLF